MRASRRPSSLAAKLSRFWAVRSVLKFALACLAFCVCSLASAGPGALIVQGAPPGKKDPDPEQSLVHRLAQALDDDGRVSPIAWSLSDPIFRAAVDEKLIRNPARIPTVEQATEAANKLRAEYVLFVQIWQDEDMLYGKAQLYRRGKQIWDDPPKDPAMQALERSQRRSGQAQVTPLGDARIMQIALDGKFDLDNALGSLARTWAQLLGENPLKAHPARPRIETPEPDPGQKPMVVEPPPPRKVDNAQLLTEVMRLLAANEFVQAVETLREAVDVEPLDLERRRLLVSALQQGRQPELAGLEARRAARLMPEAAELWALAARSWLEAGKPDEAQMDLNEAVARAPQSPDTRSLLGEMNLMKLEFELAIEHFTFVIETSPSSDAYFKRAVARAMDGDHRGAIADLQEARNLGLALEPGVYRAQYRLALAATEEALTESTVATRTLLQRARLRGREQEVASDLQELQKQVMSMRALYTDMTAPAEHRRSHEQRVLALNLLSQCLSEVESYLKSKDEEVLSDATINLGEVFRNLAEAKQAYEAEQPTR
jgi:tetratricopeptide (TPR) repeat protein